MPPAIAKPSDNPVTFPAAGQRASIRNLDKTVMVRPKAPTMVKTMPNVCMSYSSKDSNAIAPGRLLRVVTKPGR